MKKLLLNFNFYVKNNAVYFIIPFIFSLATIFLPDSHVPENMKSIYLFLFSFFLDMGIMKLLAMLFDYRNKYKSVVKALYKYYNRQFTFLYFFVIENSNIIPISSYTYDKTVRKLQNKNLVYLHQAADDEEVAVDNYEITAKLFEEMKAFALNQKDLRLHHKTLDKYNKKGVGDLDEQNIEETN